MKQRLKRAFTITELVIVIAVIAVLAAVLIPTFASVIDESKKSHDTQYMKEINVAIADYTALHGEAPQDYDELMLVLADAGLCDSNNPFLLATALKQDDMLLVWYPGTDKVQLVDTSSESMLFDKSRGFGNMVQLYTKGDGGIDSNYAYVLCNTGHPDSMVAADAYRLIYITSGGSVTKFFKSGYDIKDLVKDMENKSWANSIVSSLMNAKNGYTYDQGIAQDILDDFKANTSAQVDLTEKLTGSDKGATNFDAMSDIGKAAVQQGVRGTLATLASLENDSKTKNEVAGKQVKFNVPEGTVVDMSEVAITPIGQAYRKEESVDKGTPKSTISVDYDGITLANMNVPENTFTSTGAELQSESDSGHVGGGYAFTYGMFGTVIAAPGQTVIIENLNLKNVRMNFNGATENIDGEQVNTFADNAGIIVGYAQGDVILRNITIDGANEKGERGLIAGYDAISGVVGRAYGAKKDGANQSSSLTLQNITVKNMDIKGERRAAGFVGFISKNMNNVTIKGCALENVTITCARSSKTETEAASKIYQCWAMTFIMGSGSNVLIKDNTLTNVVTGVDFFGQFLDGIDGLDVEPTKKEKDGGTSDTWHAIGSKNYVYTDNPDSTATNSLQNKYLLLTCDNNATLTGNKVIVDKDGVQTTYNIPDSGDGVKTGASKLTLAQQ